MSSCVTLSFAAVNISSIQCFSNIKIFVVSFVRLGMLNGHIDYAEANHLEWIVTVRGYTYSFICFLPSLLCILINKVVVIDSDTCCHLSPFFLIDSSGPVCHPSSGLEHCDQGHITPFSSLKQSLQ